MPRIRTKYKMAASLIIGASLFAITESFVNLNQVTPDYYGETVTKDASISVPVDIKKGCRIAAFGVAPWLRPGSARGPVWDAATLKALQGMGMPPEAAQRAILALRRGGGEPVGMGDSHGVSTINEIVYYPTFNTTFKSSERYSVCNESRTNFGNAHRNEYAIVYQIPDASGYVWHIGEFLACGNVSLFSPAPKGWMPGDRVVPKVAGANYVPEPSTLLLVILALCAMGFIVWRNRK